MDAEPLGYCPACGSQDRERFAHDAHLVLMSCRTCTLVYLDPQPRLAVRERYLTEYDLAEHFGPLEWRKRVLFERRLQGLEERRGDGNRLCDVGCADGQFMALARERGWDCVGFELNPPAAERARQRGLNIVEGDFTALKELPWGSFDVVTAWDSLEHVPDARIFAERLVRLAKPGGLIAVSTLNIQSLAFRVFGTNWSMVQEDHFTYWSKRSLNQLFATWGCTVARQSSFGLGRDFVRPLDRLAQLRSRRGNPAPCPAPRSAPSRRWDTNRAVLAVEQALNAILSASHSGVDVVCIARRAES